MINNDLCLLRPLVSNGLHLSGKIVALPSSNRSGNFNGNNNNKFGDTAPDVCRPLPPILRSFSIALTSGIQLTVPNVIGMGTRNALTLINAIPSIGPSNQVGLPSNHVGLIAARFHLANGRGCTRFDTLSSHVSPCVITGLSTTISSATNDDALLDATSPFPHGRVASSAIARLNLARGNVRAIQVQTAISNQTDHLIRLRKMRLRDAPTHDRGRVVTLVDDRFVATLRSALNDMSNNNSDFRKLLTFVNSTLLGQLRNVVKTKLSGARLHLCSTSPPKSRRISINNRITFGLSPGLSISIRGIFAGVAPTLFKIHCHVGSRFALQNVADCRRFGRGAKIVLRFQNH